MEQSVAMDAAEHLQEVEAWRTARLASLTGPGGWLTVVALAWLHEGPNTVGSDPASDVVIAGLPDRLGVIEVRDDAAVAELDPAGGVTRSGKPVDTLPLRDDREGHPTVLQVGSVRFHVLWREGRLALRVKDSESPARAAFTRIEHYPVDLAWRFAARFEPYEPNRLVPVPTVLGYDETYRVVGALAFDVDGQTQRLDAFLEDRGTDLFLVFGDLTNRDETYGGGRFLYVPQAEDGIVVLDFNRAYNPPCAFTPHATCALPLPQNRLPVRIEAGERRYEGPIVTA
jgi:uncharacterized protein (DUF1684 family)